MCPASRVRDAITNSFASAPGKTLDGLRQAGVLTEKTLKNVPLPLGRPLLGFGLPGDAIHAPNERLYLPNLFRGTDACIELYQHLGSG